MKLQLNMKCLQRIEEEMGKLVGMEDIKKIIKEIYAWIYVNKKTRKGIEVREASTSYAV